MGYRTLSNKDAQIIAALGGGLIPEGGEYFALGAAGLKGKWIPVTDLILSRMPFLTRNLLKMIIRIINRLWPLWFLKRG